MALQTWEETAESRESRQAAESATLTERVVQVILVVMGVGFAVYQIVLPVIRAVCYFAGW
jgi:hypothetical protein